MTIPTKLKQDHSEQSNHQQLEIALSALNAGAWDWVVNSEYTYWSDKCYELFKQPAGLVTISTWMNKVHPDDRPRVNEMWNRIPLQTGWFQIEYRIVVENDTRWIRMSGFYIPAVDDSLERITGVMIDITDEKYFNQRLLDSQQLFKAVIENTNDIIIMLSLDKGIEYISPGLTVNLGYEPEYLLGKDWKDIILEEDIPIIEDVYDKLIDGLEPELIEFRMKNSSGEAMWFETIFQPQLIGKGKSSGKIIAVSREIQNRKIAQEQQKQIEKQLHDANLTKDKFFSIIAHDLRSPFTSILGFSRLLNEEYDDFSNDERRMMIKQILTSTESTFQLLDNLLAWAKTQLGRTAFNPEFFDVESLIVETINLSIPQARIKGISLKVQIIEKTKVFADVNMIRTVLRNFLSNAIKFSYAEGTIKIEAKLNKENISINISDNGTGIEPNTLKALFSLDEKVCSTKGTANEKGTGLGLILCKEFVEKNNGTISVKSILGEGSTFSFTIPLK